MLDCLGDPRTPVFKCCDCCSPSALTLPVYKQLAVLDKGVTKRRKRRRAVRRVDKVILKEKLIKARDDPLEQKSDFYMVGASVQTVSLTSCAMKLNTFRTLRTYQLSCLVFGQN